MYSAAKVPTPSRLVTRGIATPTAPPHERPGEDSTITGTERDRHVTCVQRAQRRIRPLGNAAGTVVSPLAEARRGLRRWAATRYSGTGSVRRPGGRDLPHRSLLACNLPHVWATTTLAMGTLIVACLPNAAGLYPQAALRG